MLACLDEVYAAMPESMRMLLEYKPLRAFLLPHGPRRLGSVSHRLPEAGRKGAGSGGPRHHAKEANIE